MKSRKLIQEALLLLDHKGLEGAFKEDKEIAEK